MPGSQDYSVNLALINGALPTKTDTVAFIILTC